MKRFITKLIIFTSILFLIFGINLSINQYIIKNTNPLVKADILIAGDSHLKRAIDPNLFKSCVNISQGAEPYVITYWKLKYILDHYKPKVIILGFSHHNLSAFNDLKFHNKKWSSEMFKRSYIIENFESIDSIEIDYMEFYKIYFKQMALFPHNKHFKFLGKYTNNNKTNLSNFKSAIDRHYFYKKKQLDVSQTAISYLNLIIKLCEQNDIQLLLAGSPVHEKYYNLIPESIKDKYEYEKSRLIDESIQVLDYTSRYFKDNDYLDANHLNQKGASQFTQIIINFLNESGDL